MATNTRLIDASPASVWEVLADGWLLSGWVVGCSHMRAVEAGWPAAGTRAFHTFGVWPLAVRDQSEVEESEPERRLVLTARARPFGAGRVTLDLEPEAGGTRVTMHEVALTGPKVLTRSPVVELAVKLRNVEALNRLAARAEHRVTPE